MCDAEGMWLILAILKTIVFFVEEMKVELGEKEAVVLFCIYRLRAATSGEIIEYAEKLRKMGKKSIYKLKVLMMR